MAAEIAPHAQLVYNDYGTEHDAAWNQNRRKAILRLIEQVRKAGGRIDALGLQASAPRRSLEPKSVRGLPERSRGFGDTPDHH